MAPVVTPALIIEPRTNGTGPPPARCGQTERGRDSPDMQVAARSQRLCRLRLFTTHLPDLSPPRRIQWLRRLTRRARRWGAVPNANLLGPSCVLCGHLGRPTRSQFGPVRGGSAGTPRFFFVLGLQVVRVPRRKQSAELPFRFEEVHPDALEV